MLTRNESRHDGGQAAELELAVDLLDLLLEPDQLDQHGARQVLDVAQVEEYPGPLLVIDQAMELLGRRLHVLREEYEIQIFKGDDGNIVDIGHAEVLLNSGRHGGTPAGGRRSAKGTIDAPVQIYTLIVPDDPVYVIDTTASGTGHPG